MSTLREIGARAVILPIRGYQMVLSPLLPRSCRYHPSCSQYAIDAVSSYGALRGTVLAAWRILRCNPLSDGGYDPVERQRLFKTRPAPCEHDRVDVGEGVRQTGEAERASATTHPSPTRGATV